jgi:hypothetical protein
MRSRLAEGGALAMRLSLVFLMPHIMVRLFSLPLRQRCRFISIAGRQCRSGQIAELTRADWFAHRVLAAFLAKV